MKQLLAAIQFMTRLPVPAHWTANLPLDAYARGVAWLPIVGVIIGGLCAAVFSLAQSVLGIPLAASLTVLANALLTGAFHLDGLADTCDGIFSARKRERMLEIMRDSRIGTNGALALVFAVVVRALALAGLAGNPNGALPFIIVAPVVSRSLITLLMYRQHYARENGLGNVYIGKIDGRSFALALLVGALLTGLVAGPAGLGAAVVAAILAIAYRAKINRALGGQTGDTLGCGVELFEWLFLLAALGIGR
ncbi:adenosylcobinamide-GDP ribazoletransferase [Martelella alba]|uniref:Adenosylcobinamide-GDP ribazoletransferase n=1 Tax=Martelella alba TaxID=2590451 RepID=A0ABY2SPN6_9HYPH|nr:adenosylcobinamide-GDP ribazoletransferase [Martelella alba]TKI08028.1 adenosylcobinamide-GDP ribazoletransferase [Martelella alba]